MLDTAVFCKYCYRSMKNTVAEYAVNVSLHGNNNMTVDQYPALNYSVLNGFIYVWHNLSPLIVSAQFSKANKPLNNNHPK